MATPVTARKLSKPQWRKPSFVDSIAERVDLGCVQSFLARRMEPSCRAELCEIDTESYHWREHFCRDKHFVATSTCLPSQTYLSRQNTSQQKYAGRDRTLLSRQNYICRDKYLSWQKFCQKGRNKRRVLWRQKWYLCQLQPMIESGQKQKCTVKEIEKINSNYAQASFVCVSCDLLLP